MRKRFHALWFAGCLAWPRADATGADVAAAMQGGDLSADVATLAEPDQRYSLFLPAGYDTTRRWPVMIMLDARGRGPATLDLILPAARRKGWIVLSSRNSQSDVDEAVTLRALQALLRETGQRYAYDPRRIYLAGFSGTAKTAWTQVGRLQHVLAGVLGASGGRPPELGRLQLVPLAFFGSAGTADFNYQEMRELDRQLAAAGASRRLAIFNGGHAWPPPAVFEDALDWFDLMAMQQGRLQRDGAWIERQFADRLAHAGAAADAVERWRGLDQVVRDFGALRDVSAVRAQADALAGQPAFREGNALDLRLRREERTSARRLDAWVARIDQRDPANGSGQGPPDKAAALRELRIASLQAQAGAGNPQLVASARRRLELIAVATGFYLPARYLARGNLPHAMALLEIAVAIHPDRGGNHWRLAEMQARMRRRDEAFASLATARRLGHVDVAALANDPAWESLRGDPRWAAASAPGP
jgi:predicted esterase